MQKDVTPPSTSLNRFNQTLVEIQRKIDCVLSADLNRLKIEQNVPDVLFNAMHYGLLLGGKRLRPYLVYSTCQFLNVSDDIANAIATSIESIHAYSLIHDDLPAMDDDELRRGHPTCHIQFGEATAILAADSLQTFAFERLSADSLPIEPDRQIKLIQHLAQASGAAGMCGGQMLDLLSEKKVISLDKLKAIHKLKTGALIRASVMMPVVAANLENSPIGKHLDTYSSAIGLAFQIQDDILDVIGDTKILGKQAGADVLLGKNTYPSLLGLEGAMEMANTLIIEAKQALASVDDLMSEKNEIALNQLTDLADFIILRKH
ncbi:(2E,6E)-farnesyl diphosphate synthase [Thorsellia anophelis]|uniref:Farnesyl diphosphate synthase n=1 Tax=Thorsellia anophelis DSM 18579 TaxID=1123402 RepID=A0A1H9YFD1_9GAMM|nr:(2E,6E)-farnesyl diphosphate synthase [Thorsellia anophelis]SES67614.1 farnesyl diphosphate synthase [Thorsellia anophelis DSM 18579]